MIFMHLSTQKSPYTDLSETVKDLPARTDVDLIYDVSTIYNIMSVMLFLNVILARLSLKFNHNDKKSNTIIKRPTVRKDRRLLYCACFFLIRIYSRERGMIYLQISCFFYFFFTDLQHNGHYVVNC